MKDWLEACWWGLHLLCVGLYVSCWWFALKAGRGSGAIVVVVLFHGFLLCRTAGNWLMEYRREYSHRRGETERSA